MTIKITSGWLCGRFLNGPSVHNRVDHKHTAVSTRNWTGCLEAQQRLHGGKSGCSEIKPPPLPVPKIRRMSEARVQRYLGPRVPDALETKLCRNSADSSIVGPKRLVGETGEARKGTLSASLISISVSHKWCSSITRLDMDLSIAWTVALVVHRARSVMLRSSLKAVGSRPDTSMLWRSLAW